MKPLTDSFVQGAKGHARRMVLQPTAGFKGATELSRACTPLIKNYAQQLEMKRIINRILSAQRDDPFQTLSIISEHFQKEKAIFLAALALGYALFLRKRVLIMDTVHQSKEDSLYFHSMSEHRSQRQSSAKFGDETCLDFITTRSICQEIQSMYLQEVDQGIPSICDVSDFLFEDFLESQRKFYDLIILDLCPLAESNSNTLDPMVLATQSDRVILYLPDMPLSISRVNAIEELLINKRVVPLGVVTGSRKCFG